MRFKLFQSAICTCAVIMSAFALSGCSNNANEPYEAPSDSSSVESSVESTDEFSSEDSAVSSEQSAESDPESDSDWGPPYEPFREIWVDEELLKTEEDIPWVTVYIDCDVEAIRAEYIEKYPKIADNPQYWVDFLIKRIKPILIEFLSDHNIAYEDVKVVALSNCIRGKFDKETLSSMLKDPRVSGIVYQVGGGRPLSDDI